MGFAVRSLHVNINRLLGSKLGTSNMRMTGSTITLAFGLLLSGCEGTLSDLSGTAPNAYPGYYTEPGYVTPYAYQPGYDPYPYPPQWEDHDHWHEHEWRQRRENGFENERYGQRRQSPQPSPPVAAQQPHSSAPPARSPSIAPPQTDQNRRLLDQLGFRPSR
jgi:hypothetical protein